MGDIGHRTGTESRPYASPAYYIFPTLLKEVIVMDPSAISTLIGTLGFPIACVIAMFYMWNKEREDHKDEMEKVTQALNNNTTALIKIEELLRNGHN